MLLRCLGIRRNVEISAKTFRGNRLGLPCEALWRKGFPLVTASILQSFLYCTILSVLTPKRAFLHNRHFEFVIVLSKISSRSFLSPGLDALRGNANRPFLSGIGNQSLWFLLISLLSALGVVISSALHCASAAIRSSSLLKAAFLSMS